MVWIHGGSYTTGNGYQGFYGGHVLSAVGDVIIVTMNYRLSTFGFLSTGKIRISTPPLTLRLFKTMT